MPGVHNLTIRGNSVSLEVDAERINDVLLSLTKAGVRTLVSQPPTLEKLFLQHYEVELPVA